MVDEHVAKIALRNMTLTQKDERDIEKSGHIMNLAFRPKDS